MSVLVVAPHPDDEVLGCGGTIARYVASGTTVDRCIVTKAGTQDYSEEELERREREIAAAAEELGIDRTFSLGHPAAELDTVKQRKLNEDLAEVIGQVDPDELLLPSNGDLHRDHRLVFEAALVAARPHREDIGRILSYETPSETEWGRPLGAFEPNVFIDITDTLDQKLAALSIYGSELRKTPHPRSEEVLQAYARKRGSEISVPAAEAFSLVRETSGMTQRGGL